MSLTLLFLDGNTSACGGFSFLAGNASALGRDFSRLKIDSKNPEIP
jgi:hypothetical protein